MKSLECEEYKRIKYRTCLILKSLAVRIFWTLWVKLSSFNYDEKLNDFNIAIIAELRYQIKQEVSEEIKKKEELESIVCMLQEHVKNYQKQVNELKDSQQKLKQYGRVLCIRIIDGVPMAENETSNKSFAKCQIDDWRIQQWNTRQKHYRSIYEISA